MHRLHDREHPLLRLGDQHLLGGHRRLAQRHPVEVDVHAGAAVGGGFRQRAGEPGAAEVLDAHDEVAVEQLERALGDDLLGEGIADLDARSAGGSVVVEGGAGQDRHPADAVPPGLGAEQDHRVAVPGRLRGLHPRRRQDAETQCVDQRVPGVGRVEADLAADVRQSHAVPVAADPGDDARQDASRVIGIGRAESQAVHHRDRPGAHREDVADDAADPGRRTLVRLDERRVVVRLDLERHREPAADVDHPGVLADAGQHPLPAGEVAELTKVHLARLVGAVLAPHHRIHGELGRRRRAAERVDDALVFVVGEAEFAVRLLVRVVGPGEFDRKRGHAATASVCRAETNSPRPSSLGPVSDSIACSGCGINPTMRPSADVSAGDVVKRIVRIPPEVAEGHSPLAFQLGQSLGRGDVTALTVLDRDEHLAGRLEGGGPGGAGVLDAQPLVPADEVPRRVAGQRTRQEVRLAEHLEAVADPEHRQPAGCRVDHRADDR